MACKLVLGEEADLLGAKAAADARREAHKTVFMVLTVLRLYV